METIRMGLDGLGIVCHMASHGCHVIDMCLMSSEYVWRS